MSEIDFVNCNGSGRPQRRFGVPVPARMGIFVCLVLSLLVPSLSFSQFTDQTEAAGVEFRYISSGPDKNHIIEAISGGGAFFDYDNDGDLDLYAVNGATVETYRQKSGPGNVLYSNNGNGTFADVSAAAGVGDASWGIGCAVGDVDGDGYRDLYVTNYGPNILYRNQGDGRFQDISDEALAGVDYSSSAAFFDYDNDGDLDLYVANYVIYDPDNPPNKICNYMGAIPIYCGPRGLPGGPDRLYRNDADKGFTDVTRPSGVEWANRYYGLGVIPADFDSDGDTDLFVANDNSPNLLFWNQGDGTFREGGLRAGVAYNDNGKEESCMGPSSGDFDNDGDLDLYITNFHRESNTLFRNEGQGQFSDFTISAGLEQPALPKVGMGTGFLDYDHDGDLDIFVANGHVYPEVDDAPLGTSYRQENQLYRNDGGEKFVDVSAEAGPGLAVKKVSMGAVFGDYDNDGDIDIFVVDLDDVATLLRNDFPGSGNWLTVQLFASGIDRDVPGAQIRLVAGGKSQWRTIHGAGFLSYNDLRANFGLGEQAQVDLVEIVWPDGTRRTVESVPANKLLVVRQGGDHAVLDLGATPYLR